MICSIARVGLRCGFGCSLLDFGCLYFLGLVFVWCLVGCFNLVIVCWWGYLVILLCDLVWVD